MEKTKMDINGLSPSATLHSGEGFSEHYIDCSANPYDLRPAADIIVERACEMMKTLPEDTPLVILMGECHKVPSHHALQQMVALRLLESNEHFTFAFEQQHNFWSEFVKTATPDRDYDCASFDPDGKAVLSACMAITTSNYAPVSDHNLKALCYHNDIASVFNDSARNKNDLGMYDLDLNDPFTAATAAEYAQNRNEELPDSIGAVSPYGMAIRNLVMARRGLIHAKENEVRLFIQGTGAKHVFGSPLYGGWYEDSLCMAYRRAGAAVLPVLASTGSNDYGLHHIPIEKSAGSVLIDGLAEDDFSRGDEGEKEFIIEKLHKHSGNELSFYDVAGQKEKYRELAIKHAEELLARAVANDNPVPYHVPSSRPATKGPSFS